MFTFFRKDGKNSRKEKSHLGSPSKSALLAAQEANHNLYVSNLHAPEVSVEKPVKEILLGSKEEKEAFSVAFRKYIQTNFDPEVYKNCERLFRYVNFDPKNPNKDISFNLTNFDLSFCDVDGKKVYSYIQRLEDGTKYFLMEEDLHPSAVPFKYDSKNAPTTQGDHVLHACQQVKDIFLYDFYNRALNPIGVFKHKSENGLEISIRLSENERIHPTNLLKYFAWLNQGEFVFDAKVKRKEDPSGKNYKIVSGAIYRKGYTGTAKK